MHTLLRATKQFHKMHAMNFAFAIVELDIFAMQIQFSGDHEYSVHMTLIEAPSVIYRHNHKWIYLLLSCIK